MSPFYFEAGYAGWAKRLPRPFPSPFCPPPSKETPARAQINGSAILGVTNGDDAVLVSSNFLAANDGVGAWAQKEKGHAGLWSRLIIHFWMKAAEEASSEGTPPDPVRYLSSAFAATKEALSGENEWLGTTTASSALLHHSASESAKPVLYVTQLGDCKIMVVRPNLSEEENVIFKTEEQYHYFDCPRQLGTNSPDTPDTIAVMDKVDLEVEDIVLALSDGCTDNLWEHEIARIALSSLAKFRSERSGASSTSSAHSRPEPEAPEPAEAMKFVARQIVLAARKIAEDPFAESPYMEKGVEEGLAIEGGKPDDISVVAGVVRARQGG
jgi:protein phosphatase PTC7